MGNAHRLLVNNHIKETDNIKDKKVSEKIKIKIYER